MLPLYPIPALLYYLGTQATSGIVAGLLSGALFGGMREATILLGLRREQVNQVNSSWLRSLLLSLAPIVRILNILCVLFSVPLLMFIGSH